MAGAAAGDEGDLGAVPVGADDDADMGVAVEAGEFAAAGSEEAVDCFGDEAFTRVHELFHGVGLSDAGARGIEPEGIVRADHEGFAGFEGGVGFGEGDEAVGAEGEVQAGLVAEVFDPGDGGGLGPRR